MDYASIAAEAEEMIVEFGQSITVGRIATITDGVTGEVDEEGRLEVATTAVEIPVNEGSASSFDNQLEALSAAKRKVRLLLIPAVAPVFEIEANDEITLGGTLWNVLGCTPISPAGTPVLYEVGVVQK